MARLVMMGAAVDVLGLGYAAVDDLVYVDAYPAADAKAPILRRERQCGGLTATALVTAARLGSTCAYAGVLGDDELSAFVVDRLREEGIAVGHVIRRAEARPVHSIIVVDIQHKTRNILYDLHGVVGADRDQPTANVIRAARVLFVDPCGMEGMIRAAQIARAAGIPVVADLETDGSPHFHTLLGLVDHLILSRDFAEKITGVSDPARAACALWTAARTAVVITCGADGCWYLTGSEQGELEYCPAYTVDVVDTTGCGDVFHGAYASALAQGQGMRDRIRLASAAAALKATCPGGQAGIPTRASIDAFLKEQNQ